MEELPDPLPISAEMITTVSYNENAIVFSVLSSVPQPCWKFHKHDIDNLESVINIKIFGQRFTNDPCIDVFSSIESEITVPVTSSNTYLFKFWKYNGATLDTTINVP